jgi:hypothetical protein
MQKKNIPITKKKTISAFVGVAFANKLRLKKHFGTMGLKIYFNSTHSLTLLLVSTAATNNLLSAGAIDFVLSKVVLEVVVKYSNVAKFIFTSTSVGNAKNAKPFMFSVPL